MPDQDNEGVEQPAPDATTPTTPAPSSPAPYAGFGSEPAPTTAGPPSAVPQDQGASRLGGVEPQQKSKSRSGLRRVIGFVVAIAVGIGFTYFNGKKESDDAPAVGECAKSVGDNKIEKVSCDSPDAQFEVVSRVDGSTDGESACASQPQATSYYTFHAQNTGVDVVSFVLCLTDH